MKLRTIVVMALLAGAGALAWRLLRAGPASSSQEVGPAAVLHVQLGAEPGTLDPALARTLPETFVVMALFEGLYVFDPRTLEPRPALAEAAETSSDGRRWTFRLREARWTNGDGVTATDFVWSWTRARSAALRAPYARLFDPIRSVRAEGEATLVVELAEPAPWLPSLLCYPPFLPVHRATVEAHGDAWNSPRRIVSNGPFALASRRWQGSLLLERSATWREAGRVRLSAARLYTASDPNRAANLYEANGVDWAWSLPESKVGSWQTRGDWRAATRLSVRCLRLDPRVAPFHDARVRRAVTLAIDREGLVQGLAGEEPARSFVPPGIPGYGPSTIDPDVEEANRLLEAAGYPHGAGLPRVELAAATGDPLPVLSAAVSAQLRAKLALDVRVVPAGTGGRPAMVLSTRGAEAIDPWSFLAPFAAGRAQGRGDRTWFDELLSQSALAARPADRMDLLRQAERALVEDEALVVPLTFPREGFLLRQRVKGVYANGLGVHPLAGVWLEPPAGEQ